MQNSGLISVIIPAYNCSEYLTECIDSLKRQTYQFFEIILIDDGSTDGTGLLAERLLSSLPQNARIIRQDNAGAAKARNVGLDCFDGDYVAFIDADDYIFDDYFETLITAAKREDADLVTSGYEKYDTDTNKVVYVRNALDWRISTANGLTHVFQYSPCAKLIRRDLVIEHNLRFVENEIMEDAPFGIVTNSLARHNICLDYRGYRYRVHSGSVQDGVRTRGLNDESTNRRFPFNGLKSAIETTRRYRGSEYDALLEYCVIKALAGFVFSFSRNSDKNTLKYTCSSCRDIVLEYFPGMAKSPFLNLRSFKTLPLSHRAAVSLFKFAYSTHTLYPFARIVQVIEGFGNHLK